MQAFKIIGLLALAAVLGIIALVVIRIAPAVTVPPFQPAQAAVTNFEECAAAGNPVMESYPRQCDTPDGQHFVEDVPQQPDPYQTSAGISANGCAIAGCSQQLCVSAEEAATMVTTCEFRAEYACYAEASCEPQADGQCGWTETPELEQCLASPPPLDPGFEGELQVL